MLSINLSGHLAVVTGGTGQLGRVMVRRPDGTGFAAPAEAFAALWQADGAPQVVLYGGRLPDGIPVGASGLMPATPTAEALAVDLLQGRYIRDNRTIPSSPSRTCAVRSTRSMA